MSAGPFVLDASVTLAWVLDENLDPASARALTDVATRGAVVPVLWRHEVANGLLMVERRNRIDSATRAAALTALADLPIEIDGESAYCAWRNTIALAAECGLTVYDAAYLDLALRRKCALASLDKALRQAAGKAGVNLI
ncbi:type II toxin-antitoxin system VapC family toxin [Microbaculum sp. FT89]|uniref:type II toxin-antitoxin system VapC family toxin n=1 Tax=Microbaculum sp. FT89 TaxID=3447298 RepID=UPI003F52C186